MGVLWLAFFFFYRSISWCFQLVVVIIVSSVDRRKGLSSAEPKIS